MPQGGAMRQPPRPLPGNLTPIGTRCITIAIPDDDEWERAAYAALVQELALAWYVWEKDLGKNGTKVAKRWREALKTWKRHKCETPGSQGVEVDCCDMCQLVFHDCKLFVVCAGTEVLLADIAKCVAQNSGSPSPGGTVPHGTCVDYDFVVPANGSWPFPVPLFTGDTLQFSAVGGMWHDMGETFWRCPNGQLNTLGICGSSPIFVGTDPLPTDPHMELLLDAGGVFANAFDTLVTVAGADSGVFATLQANITSKGTGEGTIQGHVKYCRAAAPVGVGGIIYQLSTPASPVVSNGWQTYVQGSTINSLAPTAGGPTALETYIDVLFGYTETGGVAHQVDTAKGLQITSWSDSGGCDVFPGDGPGMWHHSWTRLMPDTGMLFNHIPAVGECVQAVNMRSECAFSFRVTTSGPCP